VLLRAQPCGTEADGADPTLREATPTGRLRSA
jgi:hypothetical protein